MTTSTIRIYCLAATLLSCGRPFARLHPAPPPPLFVPPAGYNEIAEIALQRGGCLIRCPVYELHLRRTGPSMYLGRSNASMNGRYQAVVDSPTFQTLAQLLVARRFFAMDSVQSSMYTDTPTTYITALLVDGRKKRVIGQDAPAQFLELAREIDSVAAHLQWHPVAR